MPTPSALTVGCTRRGYCVRVAGRGTMRESPALRAFALQVLDEPGSPTLDVDLTACEYLDSTFLGGLLGLFRRFEQAGTVRAAGHRGADRGPPPPARPHSARCHPPPAGRVLRSGWARRSPSRLRCWTPPISAAMSWSATVGSPSWAAPTRPSSARSRTRSPASSTAGPAPAPPDGAGPVVRVGVWESAGSEEAEDDLLGADAAHMIGPNPTICLSILPGRPDRKLSATRTRHSRGMATIRGKLGHWSSTSFAAAVSDP